MPKFRTRAILLYNLALEKVAKMMQSEESGIAVNDHQVHIVGFADDLNIVSESLESVIGLTTVRLGQVSKELHQK